MVPSASSGCRHSPSRVSRSNQFSRRRMGGRGVRIQVSLGRPHRAGMMVPSASSGCRHSPLLVRNAFSVPPRARSLSWSRKKSPASNSRKSSIVSRSSFSRDDSPRLVRVLLVDHTQSLTPRRTRTVAQYGVVYVRATRTIQKGLSSGNRRRATSENAACTTQGARATFERERERRSSAREKVSHRKVASVARTGNRAITSLSHASKPSVKNAALPRCRIP